MRLGVCASAAMCLVACDPAHDVAPDADLAAMCGDVSGSAEYVEGVALGPFTDTMPAISMPAASPGDLLVVTIASTTASFGALRMTAADTALQVGLADRCGRWSTVWSVGNIATDVSSFGVEVSAGARYAVFVHRFRGLAADAGAHLTYDYSHATSARAPRVAACPGAAVVSAVISCGSLALAPGTGFTGLDVIDGTSTAAYVPDAPGYYGAAWDATDLSSTTTVAFH